MEDLITIDSKELDELRDQYTLACDTIGELKAENKHLRGQIHELTRQQTKPKKPKRKSRTVRLAEALNKIEEGKNEIDELREEIDNWKSNMEGTNLENSAKYSELEDCLDLLEAVVLDIEGAEDDAEGIEFPGMF